MPSRQVRPARIAPHDPAARVAFNTAAARALHSIGRPALSAYDVGRVIFALVREPLQPAEVEAVHAQVLRALTDTRFLMPSPVFRPGSANPLSDSIDAGTAEILCSLDPFACLSHARAMTCHGLTRQASKKTLMATPVAAQWREQALAGMAQELGARLPDHSKAGLPELSRPRLTARGRKNMEIHERSQIGSFVEVAAPRARVATLGQVFMDMLREPALCTGIQQVLKIDRLQAKHHLAAIVSHVEEHGQPIDKVRAGYVITEICGLSSPLVDSWEQFAQRGGSRKLDARSDYAPMYSERWQLSLNVPSQT